MAKRRVEIGATIPLNVDDLKQAVALWVKAEYGVEVKTETVTVQFAIDYDSVEVSGAIVTLDRETLRDLLIREGS